MVVEQFDVLPCNMPQSDPGWRFSIHANRVSKGWLVQLVTDTGVTGYGYASATRHMGASAEGLKSALDAFAPLVIGRDPFDIEATLAALDHELSGINQAKAAIDCAMHEIIARSLDLPLHGLFGGTVRDEVAVMRVLSIKDPDEMAKRGRDLVADGYRFIKIKVDGHVNDDYERVRAIRKAVGPDIRLTIDANQAYVPKDAVLIAGRVADLGVEIFEQPVAADDHDGLKLVTDNTPITVEADESAGSLREVMVLVSNRIVDAVSLKLPKLGGLRNAIAAARVCEAGRIRCRFGAHVGPRLMSAQAAHLAAGLAELDSRVNSGSSCALPTTPQKASRM
ncbi:MAG TPA: enolase C-terminal domain-like protein [Alphaproteobacteria bacterium]|nr:enolase C-terminal domain-like protein [Alphaproteobacteria bacterium]